MSEQDSAPPISGELIAWLERRYPEKCADPKDDDRTIWIKAGERRLVRHLILEHRRQQDDSHVLF